MSFQGIKLIKASVQLFMAAFLIILPLRVAEAQITINGLVMDEYGEPLPAVNVLLLNVSDSSMVRGVITDNSGVFQLATRSGGPFLLSVSMIGFERHITDLPEFVQNSIHLDPIVLREAVELLGEVAVTARRPLFELEIDRLVINVQGSITSSGSTALEVLEKSPGVQVNRQSNSVSMSGKSGVRVMINNKFVQLPLDAVVQMLDGMSAANIEQIELITTPPARYEAEGDAGIIHIKMKDFAGMGTSGTIGGNLGYNYAETLGGNFNISHRRNKLALFLDYSIYYDRNQHFMNNERSLLKNGFPEVVSSYNIRRPTIGVQNARTGMEYQIGRATTAGFLITGYQRLWKTRDVSDNFNRTGPDSSLLTEMSVRETNRWQSGLINASLDHSFSDRSTISLDLDYLYYINDNPSFYQNRFVQGDNSLFDTEGIDVTKETPISIWVAKTDYSYDLSGKLTLETGLKGSVSEFSNTVRVLDQIGDNWVVNPRFTQNADLTEKTAAAYLAGNWSPAENLRINAGLRYEYTDRYLSTPDEPGLVDIQNGNLFPSVYIQRKFANEKVLGLSYSRRITRPTFNDLAPFVFFMDPTTFLSGNSDLNPSISDAVKLDFSRRQWLISLQYSYNKNEIASFQPVLDLETNEQTYSAQNLSFLRSYVLVTSVPFYPAPWWELHMNLSGRYHTARTGHLENNFSQNTLGYSVNITNSIDLPAQLSMEISGYYQSKSIWGIEQFRPQGAVNAGIQKRVAGGQGTIRLSMNDIFYTDKWRAFIDVPSENLDSRFSYDRGSRNVRMTFTWNFGNTRLKAVNVRTGSEEEQGRVAN